MHDLGHRLLAAARLEHLPHLTGQSMYHLHCSRSVANQGCIKKSGLHQIEFYMP